MGEGERDARIGITRVHNISFLQIPFLCFSQFLVLVLFPLPSFQSPVFLKFLLLALFFFLFYKGIIDVFTATVFHYYIWSLCWEDPLEKKMATLSSILAWSILWTEEPGGLSSMGLQKRWQDLVIKQQQQFLLGLSLWSMGYLEMCGLIWGIWRY